MTGVEAEAGVGVERDLYEASRYRTLARVSPGLVHELRGPLNGVHLNLELLKMTSGSENEPAAEKRGRYLRVVEEELARFQSLFSRFVTQVFGDEQPAERSELDLRGVVEDVEELLRVQARKEGIQLTVETPEDPVVVEGTREHLRQALLNMAVNALDALEDAAEPRRLRIALTRLDGAARLSVTDSGRGITAVLREQLGQPLATRETGGVGTGLLVARSIAEAHGGRLGVESPSTGGSEFFIETPLAERSQTLT